MLAAPGRLQSNLGLVLSVLLLAAIFTTGSRGALLALIPALLIFAVFARAHLQRHKRCVGILLGLGALSFILISVFVPAGSVSPAGSLASTFGGTQSLLWARPAIWASAWQIFQDHWLVGTGIGTFFLYYPEVRSTADGVTAGLMAHSDPLQFAVEMGVLAPLIFYALIGFAIVRTVQALKNIADDDARRVMILAPFCAFGALVFHAHITFHFHVLSILMAAGILLGFWFVQTAHALGQSDDKPQEAHARASVRWGLSMPLLLALFFFAAAQSSEILVNRGQKALMTGDMQGFANDINRAGVLSNNRNARALITAANVPLGALQLNAPLMPKDELVALYSQVQDLLDRAEAANPRLVQIPYHRAELHSFAYAFLPEDAKQGSSAAYYLKTALALDPLHLGSRVKLANMTARAGEKREALAILERGLAWRYKNQNPRFFLEQTMRLAAELGDESVLQKAQGEFRIYFPEPDAANTEDR